MSAQILTPDGQAWTVTRRVLLWRPRRRLRFDVDPVGFLLGVVGVLLFVLEWLLALVLTAGTASVKLALRRPWRIDAVLAGRTSRRATWHVPGWRAAGTVAEQVRAEIAVGEDPMRHAHERAIRQDG